MLVFLLLVGGPLRAQNRVVDKQMHHLRAGEEREWDFFRTEPKKQLTLRFNAQENTSELTLSLRQKDVKLAWNVYLNGVDLGKLDADENARIRYLSIPPHTLKTGENTLLIAYTKPFGKTDRVPDDMLVGEITLLDRPLKQMMQEATLTVTITERETNRLIPARITIVDDQNNLQPVAVVPDPQLAVRTGCVYTGNGKASFRLPEGTYRLYATRGFEYGVDSFSVAVKAGQTVSRNFVISREVPTKGWVASDTHIHTFTYSRHGDATVAERLLTLAGEGIELPIFTDHNILVDVRPTVRAMGMDTVFTPVMGNEFTTEVGHFNVFPVADNSVVPDHHVKDWKSASRNLANSGRVIILNHARDVHYNFRPFGPERHVSVAGLDLEGWTLPAQAMEVLNSSSQQKDIGQLYRDWFGVLNRGHWLTPVGSSDSHDVMQYLVGQGRTYIKCRDDKPGRIDVNDAVDQFLAGKVMVSFGLMPEITVNKTYGPGDVVPAAGEVTVAVRVLGPSWSKADRVSLYANGQKIREVRITQTGKKGVKWEGSWTIPATKQDMYLVAIAEGPDQMLPFWPIPKPYSRTSSEWHPQLIGSSGVVWIDADGDGMKTSAYAYAKRVIDNTNGDNQKLFRQLGEFDQAVSTQAASILNEQNRLVDAGLLESLKKAPSPVKTGFQEFIDSWKVSEMARKNR
ncbi:beta-galactosidase-like protein [Larkinella arboricola]|uniref:Beta-galactosidase-like protein n=2 Tax=Larkinella arboricola TaxID=643671 RepID=A0A327WS21_LARAB|nr:beta-galactosidase-like protein [Larkinella arboricola]